MMEQNDISKQIQERLHSNPAQVIVIAIKGRYPFSTSLTDLDLSDRISILLLNKFYAGKVSEERLRHFDFVHHFDAGEFWLGAALSHLNALELPQLDQCIDVLINAMKTAGPKFDTERLRLVALEEQFVRPVAKIRQRHGIPGPKPEDVDRFTDKAHMKRVASDGEIDLAKYLMVTPADIKEGKVKKSTLESSLGYPIMFKPVHGVGAAGIAKVDNQSQLEAWLDTHPEPSMEYLAEEYIDGVEYHSLALVQSSGIQLFPAPFFVHGHSLFSSIRHCLPLCADIERDPKKCSIVNNFLQRAVRVFQPPDGGLVFVQAFMTKNGRMKFSEVAYRVPGLIGSVMFTENSGISPESVQIMAQVRPLDLKRLEALGRKKKNFFANLVYPRPEGVVESLKGVPKGILQSEVETVYQVKVGEKTKAATNVGDMAVRIFLWNDNGDRLRSDIDWLKENFRPLVMIGEKGEK